MFLMPITKEMAIEQLKLFKQSLYYKHGIYKAIVIKKVGKDKYNLFYSFN